MLVIASAISFEAGGRKPPVLNDVPRVAYDELGFQGLAVHTTQLAGWDRVKIDSFRDAADKAKCPCLLLIEPHPQPLGSADPDTVEHAEDRLRRVLRVAHHLGCSSAAISIEDPHDGSLTEPLTQRMKLLVTMAERLELNLLIAPAQGLTRTPEHLTALIRKVGGFRIGSFPDFHAAAATHDITGYLRALAPYASVISASARDFDDEGNHKTFDLIACIDAIRAVGYDQTLTIEYRGRKNPQQGLAAAKSAIEAALNTTETTRTPTGS